MGGDVGPSWRLLAYLLTNTQEPERALLLCRLRLLNDAFNADCSPRALLEGGKALMPAPPGSAAEQQPKPPKQPKESQPQPKEPQTRANKRARLEPSTQAAAALATTTTTTTAAAAIATAEAEEEGRPLSFACRHTLWEETASGCASASACPCAATPRLPLVRRVLRGVVGGGGSNGKGAGLQPDLFKELLAYARPPWDPALAVSVSAAAPAR